MHENERTTVKGVEYVDSISLSGSWYKSGQGMERGVDDCPRGYRIVSVDGTKVTHRYQSSCESRVDRQGEFVRVGRVRCRAAWRCPWSSTATTLPTDPLPKRTWTAGFGGLWRLLPP